MNDSSGLSQHDLSHAFLLAVLMAQGGHVDLPAAAFESDAMGTADGSFYAVEMVPLDQDTVRLQVVPRL